MIIAGLGKGRRLEAMKEIHSNIHYGGREVRQVTEFDELSRSLERAIGRTEPYISVVDPLVFLGSEAEAMDANYRIRRRHGFHIISTDLMNLYHRAGGISVPDARILTESFQQDYPLALAGRIIDHAATDPGCLRVNSAIPDISYLLTLIPEEKHGTITQKLKEQLDIEFDQV